MRKFLKFTQIINLCDELLEKIKTRTINTLTRIVRLLYYKPIHLSRLVTPSVDDTIPLWKF